MRNVFSISTLIVSTHSRLKAAGGERFDLVDIVAASVSTHSRLKAAGPYPPSYATWQSGFNTQPPEGGWRQISAWPQRRQSFNTQPPEGGWI